MAVTIVPSLLHAGAVSATAFEITGGGGIQINPATVVDSIIQFKIQGTTYFTMGVDESTVNNDWVLSLGTTLGTNNVWSVDGSTGLITFTGGLNIDASSLTGTVLASNVVTSSLTALGIVGTGTWQGDPVEELYGGTNQNSYTQGDILYASASNTLSKLALGNAGDQLKVNGAGNQVAWEPAGAAGATTGLAVAMAIVF